MFCLLLNFIQISISMGIMDDSHYVRKSQKVTVDCLTFLCLSDLSIHPPIHPFFHMQVTEKTAQQFISLHILLSCAFFDLCSFLFKSLLFIYSLSCVVSKKNKVVQNIFPVVMNYKTNTRNICTKKQIHASLSPRIWNKQVQTSGVFNMKASEQSQVRTAENNACYACLLCSLFVASAWEKKRAVGILLS